MSAFVCATFSTFQDQFLQFIITVSNNGRWLNFFLLLQTMSCCRSSGTQWGRVLPRLMARPPAGPGRINNFDPGIFRTKNSTQGLYWHFSGWCRVLSRLMGRCIVDHRTVPAPKQNYYLGFTNMTFFMTKLMICYRNMQQKYQNKFSHKVQEKVKNGFH